MVVDQIAVVDNLNSRAVNSCTAHPVLLDYMARCLPMDVLDQCHVNSFVSLTYMDSETWTSCSATANDMQHQIMKMLMTRFVTYSSSFVIETGYQGRSKHIHRQGITWRDHSAQWRNDAALKQYLQYWWFSGTSCSTLPIPTPSTKCPTNQQSALIDCPYNSHLSVGFQSCWHPRV